MVSNRNITRQERRKLLRKQRLMGAMLLVISLVVFIMGCTGKLFIDQDITLVVIFIPAALYLICTKSICIYF